jgi:hypothetical protein
VADAVTKAVHADVVVPAVVAARRLLFEDSAATLIALTGQLALLLQSYVEGEEKAQAVPISVTSLVYLSYANLANS